MHLGESIKKRILVVAGARPNFMKIAPLLREFRKHERRFEVLLVHTGQHYDFEMSEVFFQNLEMPKPDTYLSIGSASHAVQSAKIMIAFAGSIVDRGVDSFSRYFLVVFRSWQLHQWGLI